MAKNILTKTEVARVPRLLVIKLSFLMTLGAVLQRFVPITRWGTLLGKTIPVPAEIASVAYTQTSEGETQVLREAIIQASSLLPVTPSCLAQAFAGQRILRAQKAAGIVVIGLRRGKKSRWPAHAWLVSNGAIVTGGRISHKYFPASAHTFGDPFEAVTPGRILPVSHDVSAPSPSSREVGDFATLVALTSAGLSAERGESPDPVPVSDPQALARAARRHRLEGFLLRYSHEINLPQAVVSVLESSTLMRAQHSLSQWASSLELTRMLHSHNIDHIVFKGRALTAQTLADADSRGGGDVDVLVAPRDVERTHYLLVANGILPVYAVEPRSALGWAFVTYRNREMPYRSDQVEVDLHWRISPERDLLSPTEAMLARKVMVGTPDQGLPTLHPSDALSACAFHFFHDYGSALRRLIDFVRLAPLANPGVLSSLPAGAQQLVADVGELCREIFGPHAVPGEFTHPPREQNTRYLASLLWAGEAGFSHQARSAKALSRAVANFQHAARYSSVGVIVPRLIARGLVWYPPATPGQRGLSVPHALILQASRVIRGKFDSHV